MDHDKPVVAFEVSELKIVTAQHVLKENGIESFVVNKKDSAHAGVFGTIQLFVEKGSEAEARTILINEEIIEQLYKDDEFV